MGKWKEFKKGLEAPRLFMRPINRFYHRNLRPSSFNPEGEPIMEKDWDICIILDACRYDLFKSNSELPGALQERISMGSATSEFLHSNFKNGSFLDTVYISGTPQIQNHWRSLNCDFHQVIHVWEDSWDPTYQTVLPSDMREEVIRSRERYPKKRIIAHFLQPHYPFLTTDISEDKGKIESPDSEVGIWKKVVMGRVELTEQQLWDAYSTTLNEALGEVEKILGEVDGKIVVTSDHGNFVGDSSGPVPVKDWGHPVGIYQPELVRVPWHIYESGTRPAITSEEPSDEQDTDTDITGRLRALGYTE
jgi:hypothetical protein